MLSSVQKEEGLSYVNIRSNLFFSRREFHLHIVKEGQSTKMIQLNKNNLDLIRILYFVTVSHDEITKQRLKMSLKTNV